MTSNASASGRPDDICAASVCAPAIGPRPRRHPQQLVAAVGAQDGQLAVGGQHPGLGPCPGRRCGCDQGRRPSGSGGLGDRRQQQLASHRRRPGPKVISRRRIEPGTPRPPAPPPATPRWPRLSIASGRPPASRYSRGCPGESRSRTSHSCVASSLPRRPGCLVRHHHHHLGRPAPGAQAGEVQHLTAGGPKRLPHLPSARRSAGGRPAHRRLPPRTACGCRDRRRSPAPDRPASGSASDPRAGAPPCAWSRATTHSSVGGSTPAPSSSRPAGPPGAAGAGPCTAHPASWPRPDQGPSRIAGTGGRGHRSAAA